MRNKLINQIKRAVSAVDGLQAKLQAAIVTYENFHTGTQKGVIPVD
jgi:hypothetical protein